MYVKLRQYFNTSSINLIIPLSSLKILYSWAILHDYFYEPFFKTGKKNFVILPSQYLDICAESATSWLLSIDTATCKVLEERPQDLP